MSYVGKELAEDADYRLRTVRIGVWATLLVVGGLMIFPYLPGGDELMTVPYMSLLVVALVGVGVVATLPWGRLVERGLALGFLYTWSVLDIVLITGLVVVAGDDHSGMVFMLYALTTVFFGAAGYSTRAQVGLLLFTFACYLAALFVFDMSVSVGMVIIRLTILAGVAYISSFLAGELTRRMAAESDARRESEARAGLLATVAGAARSISTLETEAVLEAVVGSALELGFEAGNFCFFDDAMATYRISYARGLPQAFLRERHPASQGVPGLVLQEKQTVVLDDYSQHPHAVPILAEAGFRVAVGVPVFSGEAIEAVLVVGSKLERPVSPQDVEALDLLGAQAARALENARRFESEKRTSERLAELDRMKSDFLASASHELRTPLTAIHGLGATLTTHWKRMEEERRVDLLRRIVANTQSLEDIVDTLMDFSRLKEGRLRAETRPLLLDTVANQVAERLSGLLSAHRLEVDVDEGLRVEADPMLMERVIENLLANAAMHTPEGTRVRVRAYRDNGHAVIQVSDEGPGIPPEEIRYLGERFFRGGDTNTRGTRGLGLGLALTMEVLELHGSKLEITSDPGKGSRFSFRLPIADAGSARHLRIADDEVTSA